MNETLAIFSPNENAYSETFIQAHKCLPLYVKYYYGGWLPTALEGKPNLFRFTLSEKIKIRINKKFNLSQHALINSLKREKVNCVLAEYGPTACATLKVVKFLKLPLAVYFLGFDASVRSIISEYGTQYKEVFDYASAVLVVSKKMKRDLLHLGCPKEKIIISICGPDSIFFKNEPTYSNAQFVSVARFVEKKAPYLTIIAFKKVVEIFPDAKLIMVGDGRLLNICKNLSKALNIANNIEFKGVQTPKEIQSIYQESIAFVQHSMKADDGDSEGTPVAVLDAQAAALPIISTNHAGIPDVVINKKTGLLIEEQDVEGMANNMIRILQQPGLSQKLGRAGRERVREYFTLEKHLNTLQNVIERITRKQIVDDTEY